MQKRYRRTVFVAALVVIIGLVGLFISKGTLRHPTRITDDPPVITFTWTPLGRVSLKDMRGVVHITDDHAIDFSTYRFRILELNRTLDLPIPGLVGKDYTQPISLSLLADNPILQEKKQVTVQISVADDAGQTTTITRVIKLK